LNNQVTPEELNVVQNEALESQSENTEEASKTDAFNETGAQKQSKFKDKIPTIFWLFTCLVIYSLLVLNISAHYNGNISSNIGAEGLMQINVPIIFAWIAVYVLSFLLRLTNESVETFMALPEKNDKITFPVISTFLGEQAFSSLMATILISFGEPIYTYLQSSEYFNGVASWLTSIYVSLMTVMMILFAIFSLIRFIYHFTKYTVLMYGILSLLSALIMALLMYAGSQLA